MKASPRIPFGGNAFVRLYFISEKIVGMAVPTKVIGQLIECIVLVSEIPEFQSPTGTLHVE